MLSAPSCGTGKYSIYLGHANLISKKRYAIEHQFVVYRGYAYEYGKSYNQELDITDPQYKYANGAHLKRGLEYVGCSSCSYDDARMFADGWQTRDYKLYGNNCQDFTGKMVKFLTLISSDSCNKHQSSLSKRQDNNDTNSTSLVSVIDTILDEPCSCQCHNSGGGVAAPTFRSVLALLMIVLIFYSFIYMLQ